MGDKNRWQMEYLQRFGVYTFFRELVKGSELTLGNDGVLAVLYCQCSVKNGQLWHTTNICLCLQ